MSIFGKLMSSGNGGSQWYVARDENRVYVRKVTVKKVFAGKNTKQTDNSQYAEDLSLRFFFVSEGSDMERELYVGGNFSRLKTAHGLGPINDFGTVFRVLDALKACGVTSDDLDEASGRLCFTISETPAEWDVDDWFRVIEDVVEQCLGKEILLLEYASRIKDGKLRTSRWDKIWRAEGDENKVKADAEAMIKSFQKGFAERGYPKNYHPELAAMDAASGGDGDGAVPEENTETPW